MDENLTPTNGHGDGNGANGNGGPALSPQNLQVLELTRKDFVSDQEVRWCPGCGDYGILAAIQFLLPELGKTAAELTKAEKNGVSHRAQALAQLVERLRAFENA